MSKNILARSSITFLLCASFAVSGYSSEVLRSRAARLFEECLAVSKKIERGEMLLNFRMRHEEYPFLSHGKQLHVVFDGDKAMMIRQDGARVVGYAFNCYTHPG